MTQQFDGNIDLIIMNGALDTKHFAAAAEGWRNGEVFFCDDAYSAAARVAERQKSVVCVILVDGLGREIEVFESLAGLERAQTIAVSRFPDSGGLIQASLRGAGKVATLDTLDKFLRPRTIAVSPAKEISEEPEKRESENVSAPNSVIQSELSQTELVLEGDGLRVENEDFGFLSHEELDALLGE